MKNSFSIFQNILFSSYNDTLYIELLLYSFSKELRVFKKEKENPLFNQQCSQERRRNPSSYTNKIEGREKKSI